MPDLMCRDMVGRFARCKDCGRQLMNIPSHYETMGNFRCTECFGSYESAPQRVGPLSTPRSGPYRAEDR
jgi:hypothetical protein